jgi:hypothetical protein
MVQSSTPWCPLIEGKKETTSLWKRFYSQRSIHIERANMHSHGIASTRSFYMSLTSADAQKLECLKEKEIIFYKYYDNTVNEFSILLYCIILYLWCYCIQM